MLADAESEVEAQAFDLDADVHDSASDADLDTIDTLLGGVDATITQDNAVADEDLTSDELQELEELENINFDELLGSLEAPDNTELAPEDELPTTSLDLDSLLAAENIAEDDLIVEEDELSSELALEDGEELIDIEELLAESEDAELDAEPYQPADMDVGLEEFIQKENIELIDVDLGNESGMTSQLDLARAYIEINDVDGAITALEKVIAKGDANQRDEATKLLDQLEIDE
ncbi:FimV/HubP family polar landmark protein [Saccharobesus litoralis]|nr:FimV/HubP family polar landmark protein [Saccharobesus litoralis]